MSAIKRYMEELAEKLGKDFSEITEDDMQDDMDSLYEKHGASVACKNCQDSCLECSDMDVDEKVRQYDKEHTEMVHKCKCNNCSAILVDTNPQTGAAVYPYNGELSTESMADEEGGLIGCPNCKTDAYLMDI
jgi:hypothetical protein